MKKFVLLIMLSVVLVSCSSTKQTTTKTVTQYDTVWIYDRDKHYDLDLDSITEYIFHVDTVLKQDTVTIEINTHTKKAKVDIRTLPDTTTASYYRGTDTVFVDVPKIETKTVTPTWAWWLLIIVIVEAVIAVMIILYKLGILKR